MKSHSTPIGTMDERLDAHVAGQTLAIQVRAAVLTGSGAAAGHVAVAHAGRGTDARRVSVTAVVRRPHVVRSLMMLGVKVVRVRLEMLLLRLLLLLLVVVVAGGAGVGVCAGGARRGATVGCV